MNSSLRHLDDLQRALAKCMRAILVVSLIVVLVVGALMIRATWSGSQGEVYDIGAAQPHWYAPRSAG